MKKFLSFLLTTVMVIGMIPSVAFAANNTATTMRLAKTLGTVTVTNATDKVIKHTENMKLYNGFKLKTDAGSYAWISLDDTKAAKLDANSVVSVQKNGNKLTLYLSSGNLFFNVKETLKSNESLNIKTSTMTMGIRGTSGCVRVINPRVSEVHLMTGKVEVFAEHPELNITKSALLTAGTMATSLIDEEAIEVSGEFVEIVIENLEEEIVCGNCAVEIADDTALQERIEEETNLDVEEIISEAEDKLIEDEKAAEEKQETIEEAVDNQEFPEVVDPYFEETAGDGDGGDDSTSAPSWTVSKWSELIEKINQFNAGDSDETITLGENLPTAEDLRGTLDSLPAIDNANGRTLTINLSNYILAMDEPLVNNGNLVITNSDGKIGHHSNASNNQTVIKNYGKLTLEDGDIVVSRTGRGIDNYDDAVFRMKGGSIVGGEITIDGSNELAYTEGFGENASSPLAINNYEAEVEISGGTIDTFWGVQGDGTIEISGGTINIDSGDGGCAFDLVNGEVTMTGGTINVGDYAEAINVSGTSEAVVNGGTINIIGNNAVGINNSGKATLSGGNIRVNSGAANAVGVQSESGSLMMENRIRVRAYNGTGVVLAGGDVTLGEGTGIWGYNEAKAVDVTAVDTVNLTRPVKASIGAEYYNSVTDQGVFNPLYSGMTLVGGSANPDTGKTMRDLEDNFGKVSGGQTLAEMIQEFNDGNANITITLEEDVDMTAVAETLPSIGTSSTDTKTLTLDLNGNTLKLAESMVNLGNLVVTGNGEIVGEPDNRLIANSGNLTWESGTLTVTKEATSGIESTGKVVMNGGTVKSSDASLRNGNMVAMDIIAGTFEMNGGTLVSEVTRSDFPSGVSYYSAIALRNSGTSDLNGGKITASTIRTTAASNIGILNVKGTEIEAAGEGSNGIVNAGTVNMISGEVTATGESSTAFNMNNSGDMVNFDGGTISADSTTAFAYVSNNNTNISSNIDTTIRAMDSGRVWTGNVPEDYKVQSEISEDGYYYLQEKEALSVTSWARFVEAVEIFNSSDNLDIITLEADINPAEEGVTDPVLPIINNVNGNTLTLNLDTYNLELPVIMNADTPLVITGTTGSIYDNTLLMENSTLISGSDVTLEGGNIIAADGHTGIYADSFEMTGGNIDASGGTGIIAANTASLKGGQISVSNGGLGIDIVSGTVSLEGATVYVNGGIGIKGDLGRFEMTSGEIEVDGGTGIYAKQADLLGGTITVNSSIGEEQGISVSEDSSITIDGTDIYVNGSIDPEYYNYGIYVVNNGGLISISGSEIIAVAGAYQAGEGNAYAVYGTGDGEWLGLTFDNSATVRASSYSNVIFPECEGYEIVEDTDGTYYLTVL